MKQRINQIKTNLIKPEPTPSADAKAIEENKALFSHENLHRLKEENKARIDFSVNILTITVIWMFLMIVIVVGVGTGNLKLTDTVLVALITTTTANVFGFMYIVANYLFNKDKST